MPTCRSSNPFQLTIGVLALQGGFSEHIANLSRITSTTTPTSWTIISVKTAQQLASVDALVIPGGESSAISIIADKQGLLPHLRTFVTIERRPVWGTCAGSILLCDQITSDPPQDNVNVHDLRIGGLTATAHRNFFGRQIDSSVQTVEMRLPSHTGPDQSISFPALFIRAPVIQPYPTADVDGQTEMQILASVEHVVDGQTVELPVAVQQANIFATCFHPELGSDSRIHDWWLDQIKAVYQSGGH